MRAGKTLRLGLIAAFLAIPLALVPTHLDPASVAADVIPPIPPSAPPALNILPSVIKGSVTGGGAMRGEYIVQALYKFSKTPAFWAAARAWQGGVATPAQAAQVTAVTSTYAQPATKLGTLTRGVGGVLTAVSGYQFGTWFGNTVVEAVGVDATGAVCRAAAPGPGQAMLGLLTGVSCDDFNALAESYVPNAGIAPGFSAHVCAASGACIDFVKQLTYGGVQEFACFSGGAGAFPLGTKSGGGNVRLFLVFSGGVTSSSTIAAPISTAPSVVGSSHPATTGCAPGNVYLEWIPGQAGTPTRPNHTLTGFKTDETGATVAPITATSTNPSRQLRCDVQGSDGILRSAFTDSYQEGSGVIPTPVCPILPDGVTPITTTVTEIVGSESNILYEEDVTPEYQESTELAPECANGTCLLDLRKNGVSCFQTPGPCAGWYGDPDRDLDYECQFGGHLVTLTECYVYAPTFEPDAPRTGDWYSDPEGNPIGGPGTNQGTDKGTFQQPVQDPAETRQCYPTGWNVFNPIEWVMRPVQCALEWAFVPRQSTVANFRNGWNELANAGILAQTPEIIVAFGNLFDVESGGCQGPPLRIQFGPGPLFGSGGMDETYYPLSACTEPMAGFALIFNSMLSATMFVAAQLAIIRYTAQVFGYAGFGRSTQAESTVKFK